MVVFLVMRVARAGRRPAATAIPAGVLKEALQGTEWGVIGRHYSIKARPLEAGPARGPLLQSKHKVEA